MTIFPLLTSSGAHLLPDRSLWGISFSWGLAVLRDVLEVPQPTSRFLVCEGGSYGAQWGGSWAEDKGKVLTIFSRVTDDSIRLRALPKVIFGLHSDLIGHVDRGRPYHVAGAPYGDIVPGLSSLSPPPLDDVAQVGAKGGGGIHGLSEERQRAGVEEAGGEPSPTHRAHSLSMPSTPSRSA